MKLRNNKIIGVKDIILDKCIEYLPYEILKIIADFHSCKYCLENDYVHCKYCNQCIEKNRKHLICEKCSTCYPIMKTVIFANRRYDYVVNKHIHCDICDSVKIYSMIRYMYYCKTCSQL